jgi:hypothetical protein
MKNNLNKRKKLTRDRNVRLVLDMSDDAHVSKASCFTTENASVNA